MTQTEADKRVRPDAMDDATVEAVGAVSEALECVERARGELYSFHQLIGHADLLLGEARDRLRDAGHDAVAERLETEVIGRNVLHGRWTFQIVEDSTTTTGRFSANTNGALGTNFSGESATYSKRR